MSEELERNKKAVTAFYDLMFNKNSPREAIEKYVGDVYIQHNPAVGDGEGALGCTTEDAREKCQLQYYVLTQTVIN